ncbi:hypothetical protein I8F96_05345 [Enterococcus casseliflavus]|nr:hypothetical protein [Enterococcus casseliflavus]
MFKKDVTLSYLGKSGVLSLKSLLDDQQIALAAAYSFDFNASIMLT